VTQGAGATIGITNLSLDADGFVLLPEANDLNMLSADVVGALTFNDASGLEICSVASIDGITAGGNVNLTSAGTLVLTRPITTTAGGGGTLTLTHGGLQILAPAPIMLDGSFSETGTDTVATAGNITTTNDNITFNQTVVVTGDIALDAGMATIAFLGGQLYLAQSTTTATATIGVQLADGTVLGADLNGTGVGQHGQLVVFGPILLGTSSGPQLFLNSGGGIPTSTGFTLIDNDANDAVAGHGAFNAVPEGGTVTLAGSGAQAQISYLGGTGNDVTVTLTTPVELLGFEVD